MKKLLSLISAAVMLFSMAACQQEIEQVGTPAGETVEMTINVSVPDALKTKAMGDASTLTKVNYEIWDSEWTDIVEKNVIELDENLKGTLTLNMIRFKTYNVLFWAQGDAAKHTWTDLREINIDYTPNIENDAFAGRVLGIDATNDTNLDKEVVLNRPFAQLNFATDDLGAGKGVNMGDLTFKSAKVTVPGLAKKYNNADGVASGTASDVTFESTAVMAEPFVMNEVSYDYLLVFYPLVGEGEKTTVNLAAEFAATCGEEEVTVSWTGKGAMNNVPVQANYRTNFFGSIYTAFGDIDVSVDDDFTGVVEPDLNIDSKMIAELLADATAAGTYLIEGNVTAVAANATDETKEDVTIKDASGELTLTLAKEASEIVVKSVDTYFHVGDKVKVIVEKTATGVVASDIMTHVRDIAVADGAYWITYDNKYMYPGNDKVTYYYGKLEAAGYKDNAFTFKAVNGGYTIQDSYGRYLYQSGTYTSFNVAAELPEAGAVWGVAEAEGGYVLTNGEYYVRFSSYGNLDFTKTEADAAVVGLADATGAKERPVLTLSKTTDTVEATAVEYTLTITSNVAWTAKASEGVTLDKASGEGNGTVVLTFAANTAATPVEHTVTVTAEGVDAQTLTLTQAAAEVTEEPEVVLTSIPDFIAAEVSTDVFYTVSGTIVNIQEISASYGNATLTIADADGNELLIYRMKATNASTTIDQLGLTLGDIIVVKGNRGEYNSAAQMTAGEYVSHEDKEAPEATGPTTVTIAEFLAAEESSTVLYRVTGTIKSFDSITSTFATLTIEDETGSLYVYKMNPAANGTAVDQLGLTIGDVVTIDGNRGSYNSNPQLVNGYYVTHEDKEAPVSSADVVIDFTAQSYANAAEVTTLSVDGVTVTFDKGSNKNTPKFYTSGAAVRAYGGNTFTISAEKKIANITFTFGSSDGTNEISADSGTFASPTWSGSANSVVFTIGGTTGNRRLQKIEVTYE